MVRNFLRFVFFVAQVCALRCTPVIVVLICGLDSSCARNSKPQSVLRFAFLVVRDLRLRFELRNSQPQFVFRFCDFLDVNLQDFVWKFFAEELFLIPVGPARGKDWAELPS